MNIDSLKSLLVTYQEDPLVIDKLIEKNIEHKIKTGTYPPKEEWTPGSEAMIKSFISCSVNHQFKQAIELLDDIKLL